MSLSLPLTTMEEFIYWEDRPAYPWSCFARLRFSGCLDRAAFESAVSTILCVIPFWQPESRQWAGGDCDGPL